MRIGVDKMAHINEADKKFMQELLVSRGTFRSFELDEPAKVLASGLIGVYYNNTEKVFGNTDFIKENGNDPNAMGLAALEIIESDSDLKKFFDIIVDSHYRVLRNYGTNLAFGGGLKRDIPFSFPIAHYLGLPHIGIYKPEGEELGGIQLTNKSGEIIQNPKIEGYNVILSPDLITEGSSVAEDLPNGVKLGWIRSIENFGGNVVFVQAIVDRCEGGPDLINGLTGVPVGSYVKIDKDFHNAHSPREHLERNLAYAKNPQEFGERYIRENGIQAIASALLDKDGKVDLRAKKSITRFEKVLKESNGLRWKELEKAANDNGIEKLESLLLRAA